MFEGDNRCAWCADKLPPKTDRFCDDDCKGCFDREADILREAYGEPVRYHLTRTEYGNAG